VSKSNNKQVNVEVWDHILHRPMQDKSRYGRAGTAIVANPDAAKLNKLYKVSG
jgi:heterodisulfide reductase subunit A